MACKKAGEAATKNGIAELAKRVPQNQALKFKDFQAKHAEYIARVSRQPEKLPNIDWEYYKRHVRVDYVKMVGEFEQKYKGVCEAFDKRHEQDKSSYFVELDKLKQQVQDEVEKYKAASNERIKALEAKYAQIKALIPYEEMTAEEYCELLPEKSFYRHNGEPSFWPHTLDEQGRGPAVVHDHGDNGGGNGHGGSSGSSGSGSSGKGGGASASTATAAAEHAQPANPQSTSSSTPAPTTTTEPTKTSAAQEQKPPVSELEKQCLESEQLKKDLEFLKKCFEESTAKPANEIRDQVMDNEIVNPVDIAMEMAKVVGGKNKQPAKNKFNVIEATGTKVDDRSTVENETQKLTPNATKTKDLPDLALYLEEVASKTFKAEAPKKATEPTLNLKPVVSKIAERNLFTATESVALKVEQTKIVDATEMIELGEVTAPTQQIEIKSSEAGQPENTVTKVKETIVDPSTQHEPTQKSPRAKAFQAMSSKTDDKKVLKDTPKVKKVKEAFQATASKTADNKVQKDSPKVEKVEQVFQATVGKTVNNKVLKDSPKVEKLQPVFQATTGKTAVKDALKAEKVEQLILSKPMVVQASEVEVEKAHQQKKTSKKSASKIEAVKSTKDVLPKLENPTDKEAIPKVEAIHTVAKTTAKIESIVPIYQESATLDDTKVAGTFKTKQKNNQELVKTKELFPASDDVVSEHISVEVVKSAVANSSICKMGDVALAVVTDSGASKTALMKNLIDLKSQSPKEEQEGTTSSTPKDTDSDVKAMQQNVITKAEAKFASSNEEIKASSVSNQKDNNSNLVNTKKEVEKCEPSKDEGRMLKKAETIQPIVRPVESTVIYVPASTSAPKKEQIKNKLTPIQEIMSHSQFENPIDQSLQTNLMATAPISTGVLVNHVTKILSSMQPIASNITGKTAVNIEQKQVVIKAAESTTLGSATAKIIVTSEMGGKAKATRETEKPIQDILKTTESTSISLAENLTSPKGKQSEVNPAQTILKTTEVLTEKVNLSKEQPLKSAQQLPLKIIEASKSVQETAAKSTTTKVEKSLALTQEKSLSVSVKETKPIVSQSENSKAAVSIFVKTAVNDLQVKVITPNELLEPTKTKSNNKTTNKKLKTKPSDQESKSIEDAKKTTALKGKKDNNSKPKATDPILIHALKVAPKVERKNNEKLSAATTQKGFTLVGFPETISVASGTQAEVTRPNELFESSAHLVQHNFYLKNSGGAHFSKTPKEDELSAEESSKPVKAAKTES